MEDSAMQSHGIGSGTLQVRDIGFATALIAAGLPLRSDNPGFNLEYRDGVRQPVFNFHTGLDDGILTAKKIKEASRDPMAFIQKNPMHPLAFTMAALMAYNKVKAVLNSPVPYVCMNAGEGAVLIVTKGSRKHRAAITAGMQPCRAPSFTPSDMNPTPAPAV